MSRTTIAQPLSAGGIMMELFCLRLFGAFRISVVMLGLGGTAFWSTLFTVLRTVSACSASSECDASDVKRN